VKERNMRVQTETIDGITVVTIPGESLEAGNAKEFKNAVADIVKSKTKVVFDLEQLQFVDSSGCGSILSCLRRITAAGGDLKLCSVQKPVRVLFELVRMHRIVDIYNTRDEAVAAYRQELNV